MGLPGLPKLDLNVGETVEEFRANLIDIQVATETAATAAVAALIGEHGTDRAAELLESAAALRRQYEVMG